MESSASSDNDKFSLPPISAMDDFLTSRSWPPPKTTLSGTPTSMPPSSFSSSHKSPVSPPISHEAWKSETSVSHHALLDHHPQHYSHQSQLQTHMQPQSHSTVTSTIEDHGQPSSSYFPTASRTFNESQLPSPSSSAYPIYDPTISRSASHAPTFGPFDNTSAPSSSLMSLASSSTSRSIETDVDDIIRHCSCLNENMIQRKTRLVDPHYDNYFADPARMRPWLDDMIARANEVLNALLRLRKYQLAAEHAKLHGIDSSTRMFKGNEEDWSSGANVMSLSAIRQRKRGKRSVFQGRCHSCNISETPEWRRGPDGARTLCNACGLHYAKLTRKKTTEDPCGNKEPPQNRKKQYDMLITDLDVNIPLDEDATMDDTHSVN